MTAPGSSALPFPVIADDRMPPGSFAFVADRTIVLGPCIPGKDRPHKRVPLPPEMLGMLVQCLCGASLVADADDD